MKHAKSTQQTNLTGNAEQNAHSNEGTQSTQSTGNAQSTQEKPKKSKKRNRLSTVLMICGIALLVVAGGMWGYAQWTYHEADVQVQKMASYATVHDDTAQAPTVDWASLKAVNDDVVGWLQVPGTVVNYPVYQGEDNDRYLRHDAQGNYSLAGQIFMDYEGTAPGMVDPQTIIYGHHFKNGTQFYPLFLLKDQATFDATPTIWYVTEEKAYELEPLMVYFTDPYDQNVRRFQFSSDEEFHTYLQGLLQKAVSYRADAAQIINGTKHVLTMSTCNYYENYGRSILVCVPKDEAAAATAQAPASANDAQGLAESASSTSTTQTASQQQ